jgi:acyl carrier protein
MSETLDQRLEGLLREVMPRKLHKLELHAPMSLRGELGIDSIGLMSLALRLEEEFQLDVIAHADEIGNVNTIGDVRDLILHLGRLEPQ